MPYISHLLRGLSAWRKEFYSQKKRSLIKGKTRDDTNHIHDYVTGENIRTGKMEELRQVTEEIRNFHILEAGKF